MQCIFNRNCYQWIIFAQTVTIIGILYLVYQQHSKGIYIERNVKENITNTMSNKLINSKEFQEFLRIERIKKTCGEICDTSLRPKEGEFFAKFTKKVNCQALFQESGHDEPAVKVDVPYRNIPLILVGHFTYGGTVQVIDEFYKDSFQHSSTTYATWTKELVDEWIKESQTNVENFGQMAGGYGQIPNITEYLKEHFDFTDSRVLVIGSLQPWIESMVLGMGAKSVVTLEYSGLISQHPAIHTITPTQFRKEFLAGTIGQFDHIAHFSSIEHSGLGRFGDPLHPWGDAVTLARAWCVTKPGGGMFAGVEWSDRDIIAFNGAKYYGPVMLSHVYANWDLIHSTRRPKKNALCSCNKTTNGDYFTFKKRS